MANPLPRIVETKWTEDTQTTGKLKVRFYNEGASGSCWVHVSADKETAGRYPYNGDINIAGGSSWTMEFPFLWALDVGCGIRVCCGYTENGVKRRSDTYCLRAGNYMESPPECPYNHEEPESGPEPTPAPVGRTFCVQYGVMPKKIVPLIRQLRDYVFTGEMHRKLHPLI